MTTTRRILAFCSLLVLLFAVPSSAQIARVFISNAGDDLNDCYSVPTACRSLQRAHDQSSAGGEVIILNSNGLGVANITKSITINGPSGVVGFIGRTITVNVAASDKVVLRGLSLNGTIFGDAHGIHFTGGGTLVVENCLINGFATNGILQSAPASRLVVNNSEFRNNGGSGVATIPSSAATTSVVIENSRFVDNVHAGVDVRDYGQGTVRNSVATGNGRGYYLLADLDSDAFLMLDTCVASGNALGVRVEGNGQFSPIARLSHCTITGNGTGLSKLLSGVIISYQTNHLWQNGTDGTFSALVSLQ